MIPLRPVLVCSVVVGLAACAGVARLVLSELGHSGGETRTLRGPSSGFNRRNHSAGVCDVHRIQQLGPSCV